MKYRAYILTFFAYVLMHSMRTGYSYSKHYFQKQFEMSNTFLAALDSIIYFSMGFGFFLRYFFLKKTQLILSFVLAGLVFTTSFLLFCLFSFTNTLNSLNFHIPSIILMFLFGFFQMHCWPISLILINQYFTNEDDGLEIGIWSSAGSIGNIVGYLFPALLILNEHMPWQIPQIILGIAFIVNLFLTYWLVERKKVQYLSINENNAIQNKNEQIGCMELLEEMKNYIFNLNNALLLISSLISKAIIYTFLLWLPIYLISLGKRNQSAIIPIAFNIAGAIGTAAFGKFYQSSPGKQNSYKCLLVVWPIVALLLIGGLIFLINMGEYDPILFVLIIIGQGFILGGICSTMITNQIINVSQKNERNLDIYTTITFGSSSFGIGLAQTLIGLYMRNQDDESSYEGVFKVLLLFSIVCFVSILGRSWNLMVNMKQSQTQESIPQ